MASTDGPFTGELIERGHAVEAIASGDEDGCIAGERPRVAGDGDNGAHLAARQLLRLGFRAGTRRIEDDSVERLKLDRRQRIAEQVACRCHERLQALGVAHRALQRRDGGLVGIEGADLRDFGNAQGEGAAAGEQVGDSLRLAEPVRDLAVEGEPRQLQPLGDWHQLFRLEALVGLYRDIDAGGRRGDQHIAIADHRPDIAGRDGRHFAQRRHEDGAGRDVEQVVAAGAHVAGADGGRVQGGAAATSAARIEQRGDLDSEAGMAQRRDDEIALEVRIGIGADMLQEAAAAGAEIGAERIDSVRARLHQLNKRAAIAIDVELDQVAGQREGDEDPPAIDLGDALAAAAERCDGGQDLG